MGKLTSDSAPFAANCYLNYKLSRESIIAHAPDVAGVYGLYNAVWIFVGEADNIRVRLLEHLAGEDPWIYRYRPSGFAFELVSSDARNGRYQELIAQTEPISQRKERDFAGWRGDTVRIG